MKESTDALAGVIDRDKMDSVSAKVRTNSRLVNDVVDELVHEVCGPLDEYMHLIDEVLVTQKLPPTDEQLEAFALNLPSILYFISDTQETLGIEEDVARAVRSSIFNKVRETAEGTIVDKDTAAELQTQMETIIVIVKSRAHKKVKLRVEAAYEMLASVKKAISRRIADFGISQADTGRAKDGR